MEFKTGRCGCGSLKYSAEGEPINSVFCYCKECQTHTGSDKWFGIWFPKNRFKITDGEFSVYSRKGDSGKDLNHIFCNNCGVTVCVEVTVGNFYSIAVSTLDENESINPSMALYAASAPSWAVFPAGLAKFDTLPPGMGE
ncbi:MULTISPECIES: GFA family protein [Microbulbifer]|uniref:GFA family protein n=1 Tax=Microbulbifer celer TaxID=435905 RepID=A0ABW3UBV0_9GAMM|nr:MULTISPECIES: GFA family protein [Microbulbifer]UFN56465.1 GFA family protein [Microbulbifer celer]